MLAEPWILDTDVTVKPLYGHQEGAVSGYNPHKPGRPSHTYHTCFIANLRLVLDVEVQPGKPTRLQAQLARSVGIARERIEAHIFVAFIAHCLQVTLKYRLKALAPGLTPRAPLEKLALMQMVDVRVPTTDGRVLILPRYTKPDTDQKLLLSQLKPTLPDQPPPRIQSQQAEVA